MLSEMGFDVCGSDYSASMLDVARKNLERRGKAIPLRQCDFRYLERQFDAEFDAVVCLTTALPHMHTDEVRILTDGDYRRLLSEAGYQDIKIYGGYDSAAYDEKSMRLIAVAANG